MTNDAKQTHLLKQICVSKSRPPVQGGQGGYASPHPPLIPNDFSIAKVALFDFTSRGKFLPNEDIDRVVAMLRC